MLRHAILVACIAFSMTAQTTAIQPPTSASATETRSFPLKAGGRLNVANVIGDIKISAWDKDEVALTASFKSNWWRGEHVCITAKSYNDSLELIAKYPEGSNMFRSASCEIELMAPRRIVANINNLNSRIVLDSITGNIRANTLNGAIVLKNVSGDINIDCLNSEITLDTTTGNIRAKTLNGATVLKNAGGNISLETLNGTIMGDVQNIEKYLDATTFNGSIELKLLNPNGTLKVSTYKGKVKIPPGAKDASINDGNIIAKYGDEGKTMNFKSFNGSILVQ